MRRAKDRSRFPRAGFAAVFETSTGHRVDTARRLATKDLVGLPDTTIALRLDERSIDALYELAIREHVFDLSEPHPAGGMRLIQPSFECTLELWAGPVHRQYRWSNRDIPSSTAWVEWTRLDRFVRALDLLATSRPEYKALPEPRGFYL
jgi:hypothetical protein